MRTPLRLEYVMQMQLDGLPIEEWARQRGFTVSVSNMVTGRPAIVSGPEDEVRWGADIRRADWVQVRR